MPATIRGKECAGIFTNLPLDLLSRPSRGICRPAREFAICTNFSGHDGEPVLTEETDELSLGESTGQVAEHVSDAARRC